MTYQEQIARFIPEGSGDVLTLGPSHAQALIDGLPVSPGPKRAIVLEGLLGRFQQPVRVLRQLADQLAEDGVVIVAAPARLNPRIGQGLTRRQLLSVFDAAGYDPVGCAVIRDERLPRPRMALRGHAGGGKAEELEERTSTGIVVSARLKPIQAPPCSVVTLDGADPPTAGVAFDVEVIHPDRRHAGELRAAAWNRGALLASGEYLAFADSGSAGDGPWLEELLRWLKANPATGAAGATAYGFGPVRIPTHQLPYRLVPSKQGEVPAVGASGMVLSRRLFVECGGFDERLGPDLDGPDLCLRLRARGLEIHQIPDLSVYDRLAKEAAATPRASRYFLFKWSGQIGVEPALDVEPARTLDRSSPAPILWSAPLLQHSGYGEEARGFVLGLDREGVAVHANPDDWNADTTLPRKQLSRLMALTVDSAPDRFINIVHSFPAARMVVGGSDVKLPLVEHFTPHPRAVRNIGRTMYETDRIPPFWVDYCNRMDEVWVPSEFNVATFSASGVSSEKLKVVPGAVDIELYHPAVSSRYLPGVEGFVFLSVFVWSLRKGWDALVRAYLEEFRPDEPVTLVMKISRHWNKPPNAHVAELKAFVEQKLGRDLAAGPRMLIQSEHIDDSEMPPLYKAADAFVLASRGEAYGRPFLEAMAMGLPTIGTRCGGNLEFMNDGNSYLVPTQLVDIADDISAREVPDYRGHRWAEPDVDALRAAMRSVFEDRAAAGARAAEGRRFVAANHSWSAVAKQVVARLEDSGVKPLHSRQKESVAVTWEGPHAIAFGMAEVNREMARALRQSPAIDLKQSASRDVMPWLTGRPPDVTVRHQWPPEFEPPATGRWVTYQPWEYGSIPSAWVEPLNRMVDEVWVPSSHVKDSFSRSGVSPDKIVVVPNGIDPARFHPGVPAIDLPTTKSHRFLFVGGTIARKGVDTLLDTYIATFRPEDDVCLVIKDLGSTSFYQGQGMGARIRRLRSDPAAPEIVYLDQEMAAEQMPGLYAACQSLVHPYRGEGFGLPIAEAMACGLAVIVPAYGACLDFCDESVAMLVEARETRLPEARVGNLPTVEPGWWAEIDRKGLADAMRRVVEDPEAARALGLRASKRISSDFTWARAAKIATGRILKLAERPPRISVCLIARDEEGSLARCLESLRGLADEIVVVDAGSTDGTVELARSHGAKVWSIPWREDFADARNESLRRATGNWVLVMDADEWLDEEARREIRRIVDSEVQATYSVRQVTATGDGAVARERRQVRLFPNRPGLGFKGRVRERLVSAAGAAVPGVATGVVIHHDGAATSRRRRAARVLAHLEQESRGERDDPAVAIDLGIAYIEVGRPADAEREAARATELLKWRSGDTDSKLLQLEAEAVKERAQSRRNRR